MPISFRTFVARDLSQMHQAFNQAFEGYFVDIKLPYDAFVNRLVQEQNTSFKLSIGAFEAGRLVGFIFTTIGIFKGEHTAYNGGTGVIPAYRGQGISQQLYERLIPLLQEQSISRCLLEVIVQNQAAIHVYNQLGFNKNRYFKCFRQVKNANPKTSIRGKITTKVNPNPDWSVYQSFGDHQTSFHDSYSHMKVKSALETIVEAWFDSELVGYVSYQRPRGRISQIGVSHKYRRQGIGSALIQYLGKEAKGLNIINVDTKARGVVEFLEHLNFENYLDQYEMVKKI